MSRRAAIVEEFDDDTDLALPNKPLPNTGTRGAILQEIDATDSEGEDEDDSAAGPASPSLAQFRQSAGAGAGAGTNAQATVQDITPYKKCVPRLLSLRWSKN